jgi:hypothetical protein
LVKFGTLDYYKLQADALNNDKEISKSGLTTTMLYVFSDVKTEAGTPKAFLLNINKGKVTASEAKSDEKSEFSTTATYSMHVRIAKGEIDARKADVKYNIMKAMKHMKAFIRITDISKELKDVEY